MRALYIGVSLLCLLGLAGCVMPGSTQRVIKIGLVGPFEGWYRPRGYDALRAARLAVQEVQASGGIAGWQVEVVALDDHLDPVWASQRARELVADAAVMGVVGGLSPSVVEAARPVYAEAGLALIAPASVAALGDSIYVLDPSPEGLAQAVAVHIAGNGGGPIALLHEEEQGAWAAALRESLRPTNSVTLASPSWTEALLAARPDWVVCAVDARLGAQALRQARDAGIHAAVVGGPDWGTDALTQVAGDAAEGAWFVTGVPRGEDLDSDFVQAYVELGAGEPGPDAVATYDATRVLLAALSRSTAEDGQPTRQGVREALVSVSLPGLTGPLQFDPSGARSNPVVRVYRARR